MQSFVRNSVKLLGIGAFLLGIMATTPAVAAAATPTPVASCSNLYKYIQVSQQAAPAAINMNGNVVGYEIASLWEKVYISRTGQVVYCHQFHTFVLACASYGQVIPFLVLASATGKAGLSGLNLMGTHTANALVLGNGACLGVYSYDTLPATTPLGTIVVGVGVNAMGSLVTTAPYLVRI